MSTEATAERLARLREQVDGIRRLALRRMEQGATGLQIAASLSQRADEFVVARLVAALQCCPPDVRDRIEQTSAVIAVGGSGRGEMAPYSDVDLLFLHHPHVPAPFADCVSQALRDYWDGGLKLGHSVRTVADALQMARQDIQFATSLVDARCLWGSESLLEDVMRRFHRRVGGWGAAPFIATCCVSREEERAQFGAAVQQLEPDVKKSSGGLRDLHLLRWIGYARYGVSDLDSLKLRGALTPEESRRCVLALDYLTALRTNLHISAGRAQDVLTRDEQLRITAERNIAGTAGMRPVERFMQEYFAHSTAIAEITASFVARHRNTGWLKALFDYVLSFRVDQIYRISPEFVSIPKRHRKSACNSLEGILAIYLTAVRYGVRPDPELAEAIKSQTPKLSADHLSEAASDTFLQILSRPGQLGAVLRSMYNTGVLELVLPAMRHARSLLQFNQYHHYTVDEHTLRTIEAAESFAQDPGPLGGAYREIHHKELLHLALLLHDAGKGYEEDHSEIGRRLALEAAQRLALPDHQRDLLVFLVHQHLLMATLAFRRDTTDPEVLLRFNHDVGSPDALRMLYVLTASDITAVGPGVWNDWKAELLTSFYDRSMVWLSGKSYLFEQPTRLQRVKAEVLERAGVDGDDLERFQRHLDAIPLHYLLATSPDRIASDLRIILRRQPDGIDVEAAFDPETRTIEYRVITAENVATGFFHKLTGALSAKRMEILSAQICTCTDGIIIDSYRVRDYDHDGDVPEFRREEVNDIIRRVLRGEIDVETLFQSRRKFAPNQVQGPVSNLPTRVVIDNETSDYYTIVDVFAHDRPGLLYRIARTLFESDLSVVLAKISTHFDQVVDVFYVTDARGRKIADSQRLVAIRDALVRSIEEFELAAAT
ncbi:MAG TPA: [protein-PII] uridylyltransferase [Planctomycetaceae bacterium]|nr:[protein-PII] uridylyltransferase [Planctomycetaceae bacterium]